MKNSISGRGSDSPILQFASQAATAMLPGLLICLCAILAALFLLPGWTGSEELIRRSAVTLLVALSALALAIPAGFALGEAAARHPNSPAGLTGRFLDAIGPALLSVLPAALLAPLVFSDLLARYPGDGVILPVLTGSIAAIAVFLPVLAHLCRISRRSHRSAMTSPSSRTASGLGLPAGLVDSRFTRWQALADCTSATALIAVTVVSITAVTEIIMGLPGLGSLLLESALAGQVGPVLASLAALVALGFVLEQAAWGLLCGIAADRRLLPQGPRSLPLSAAFPLSAHWHHSRASLIASAWLVGLSVAALVLPLFEDGTGLGTAPADPIFAALWAARHSLLFIAGAGLLAGLTGCLAASLAKLRSGFFGNRLLWPLAERATHLPLMLIALMLLALGGSSVGDEAGPAPQIAALSLAILIGFVPPVALAALSGLPDPRRAEFLATARSDGLPDRIVMRSHWMPAAIQPLLVASLPVFPRLLALDLAAGLAGIPLPLAGGGLGDLMGSVIRKGIAGGGITLFDTLVSVLLLTITGWALWRLASSAAEGRR